MGKSTIPPPKPARQLVDEYFIENRTRVLDIAAFLDRLDRAGADETPRDYRMRAFRECLQVLCSSAYPRAEQIQMILSDPRTEPLATLDTKSARGAYDHWQEV